MKVIIAGSRTIIDAAFVFKAVDECPFDITEVVCGCAEGVDSIGEQLAIDNDIPVKHMPAQWGIFGKRAGPRRNRSMAQYADAMVLIWTGDASTSRGSANMKDEMEKLSKPIYEVIYSEA